MMEKFKFVCFLFALVKHQSTIGNLKARSKMSKRDSKCQTAIQNVQAQAKTELKKSKREAKHESANQNMKAPAKTLKYELTSEMQAKTVKRKLKR